MYAVFGECCLLPLLAGVGGEVRGGEVGDSGELDWRCACILWSKGAGGIRRELYALLGGGEMYAVCCDSLLVLESK